MTTRLTIALLAGVLLSVIGSLSSARPVEALYARETFDRTPRQLGAISVIGDSVMLGSVITSPTIGDQLAANGWGPIRVRGGGSYTSGAFPVPIEARASAWIATWRATGWDAPTVLVNIGTNDSGFCATNLTCARNAIMHVVDTIGPGHRIWWPQITRESGHQSWATNWNNALAQIAAERADFVTWDWPSAMRAYGLTSGDNIHLSPDGYRTRSRLMAAQLTADLTWAQQTGGPAALPTPAATPSVVVEVGPTRLLDTRPTGPVAGGSVTRVDARGALPADATAAAVYLTAPQPDADGYLTVFDCNHQPTTSSLNFPDHVTRGSFTIAPVVDGQFCIANSTGTHLVVDLQAAFVPTPASGFRFTPLAQPRRLIDTRETGRSRIIEFDAPAGAAMVALSLTAIRPTSPGHLVAYPCSGDVPEVATVNYDAGEVVAGAAFVPVGDDGKICVYSLTDPDVTVDVTGTFSPGGALEFQPVPPTRTLDVRSGVGGWSPIQGAGQTLDVIVAPAQARAVTGTLTIVRPFTNGHLRTSDCTAAPATASVLADAYQVMTNSITTGVSDGRLCIWSTSPTATVFDTTGWWIPTP